eukprot:TRINITY_DN15095_c0_g2_i1.p1 TRINITY_DN15095_c0_g2~~TRINITY_DN15095_c0_g2_i1.p1  ORF type:complete len:255 (-),score=9.92 TRINITY_DN15095_c0_g2_i1:44-808(-)
MEDGLRELDTLLAELAVEEGSDPQFAPPCVSVVPKRPYSPRPEGYSTSSVICETGTGEDKPRDLGRWQQAYSEHKDSSGTRSTFHVPSQDPLAVDATQDVGREDNPWDDEPDRNTGLSEVVRTHSTLDAFKTYDSLDPLDDLLTEVLDADKMPVKATRRDRVSIVAGLQCLACDSGVLKVEDSVWITEAEYMNFRNFYPNVDRLGAFLLKQAGFAAYCCKCSWRSCPRDTDISLLEGEAGGNLDTGFRWRLLNP